MTDVERFELPRDDWYDEQGRIYKDVLIENLNACEQKLFEIQGLDAFDVTPPDIDTLVYPDTDLTSDDSCIVNLKSFLTIMGLINYPMELIISGRKIRKLTYWNSSYQYITKTNVTVDDATDEVPYVYVDLGDGDIKATNNPSTAASGILLGVYKDGIIRDIHQPFLANLNLMYLLADMQRDTGHEETLGTKGQIGWYNPNNNSRQVGYTDSEQKKFDNRYRDITYSDYGREV